LIITGALVDSSGTIVSDIMPKGMKCSIVSVILGGLGTEHEARNADTSGRMNKQPLAGGRLRQQ
jgi:NAD/NADP transhydrogenase beta subunit